MNWKSVNRLIYLWLIDFWQGCQDNSIAKEIFLANDAKKLDINRQRIKWDPTSYYMQNQFKMDARPKCKSWSFKTLREKRSSKSVWPWIMQWYLKYDIQSMNN